VRKDDRPDLPLVAAAEKLAGTLASYERACRTLLRTPLDSKKGVETAAQSLAEVAGVEGELVEAVNELLGAIGQMRDRQQADAGTLEQRAREVLRRKQALDALLERQAALALEVRASAKHLEAARAAPSLETVGGVLRAIDALIEQTLGFTSEAQREGFTDLAAEGQTLRQQLSQVRAKAELMRDRLARA
jgi:Na+/phosphate symporter